MNRDRAKVDLYISKKFSMKLDIKDDVDKSKRKKFSQLSHMSCNTSTLKTLVMRKSRYVPTGEIVEERFLECYRLLIKKFLIK